MAAYKYTPRLNTTFRSDCKLIQPYMFSNILIKFVPLMIVAIFYSMHFSKKKFSDTDLVASVTDLFAAGSDTTSNSIRWTFLILAKYQEEQEKLQKIIDEVVPKDRLPSLADQEQ